jgi:2-keto-3-deoxy-L-rhamnonate aldolase RhmA
MSDLSSSVVSNVFKQGLAEGRVVSTISIRIFSGIEIVHIAKSCGFDAIYIDLQHSSLSIETTSRLSIAALGVGIPAIVRVPSYGPEYICRVLDGGALGVLAPDCSSGADAAKVVALSKFAPVGERSTGGGLPHLMYRNLAQDKTFEIMNAATTVLVQIESPQAVERADEIAATPGLDAIMVGTNDLCSGYGIPGQHGHALVRESYARVIAAARKHGKYVGIGGISDRKLIAEYVGMGARIVATGTDVGFMTSACSERVEFVKNLKV